MKLSISSLKSKFRTAVATPFAETMEGLSEFIKYTKSWCRTTIEFLVKTFNTLMSSTRKLLKKYAKEYLNTMRDILNRKDIQ